jgi:hypothetical protein
MDNEELCEEDMIAVVLEATRVFNDDNTIYQLANKENQEKTKNAPGKRKRNASQSQMTTTLFLTGRVMTRSMTTKKAMSISI